MADHIISLQTPYTTNWARWFRNGMVVAAHGYRGVAAQLAHSAQHQNKMVFSRSQNFGAIYTAEAGTKSRWRFRFRSGYCSTRLQCFLLMGLEDHASSADPYCKLVLTEVGVGSTDSDFMRYGQFGGTPDDTPDEWQWALVEMDISPATEYTAVLSAVDYARPIAICVYERGAATGLDDTLTGAVDPTIYSLGQPILDEDIIQLGDAGLNLWKRNGSVLWQWSVERDAAPVSDTYTTFRNIVGGGTSVGVSSWGAEIQATRHHTYTETDVPVEFSVYAEAPGTASPTGQVRLTDGTNVIDVTNISSAGWYSATGTIAGGLTKFDIHTMKDHASTTSIDLYAFSLCEWES